MFPYIASPGLASGSAGLVIGTIADNEASSTSYSGGNLQTRAEAIAGVSRNRSVYTDTAVSNIKVIIEKGTAIVRHNFVATETSKDGKVTPLKFTMMLVWIKEKGKWRLMGRQAVHV